jgi:hypothetical protein
VTGCFCTYFDQNYLARGLALYTSLKRYLDRFLLWVLCLDELTFDILQELELPDVHLIRLADFERGDQALRAARSNRSLTEYYWTLTPCLPLYVLRTYPDLDLVAYLDADLFFYYSPEPVYAEFNDCSIGIIEHRYAPQFIRLSARTGIYNVGMMFFRNDARGIQALQWWRDQCIDWCYVKAVDGKFGDQKYLDDWPTRFEGVGVIQHKGANVAPWNVDNYSITAQDETLHVDEVPLLFYHFHSLNMLTPWLYHSTYRLTNQQVDLVYRPYLRELRLAFSRIRQLRPGFSSGLARPTARKWLSWLYHRKLTFIVSRQ